MPATPRFRSCRRFLKNLPCWVQLIAKGLSVLHNRRTCFSGWMPSIHGEWGSLNKCSGLAYLLLVPPWLVGWLVGFCLGIKTNVVSCIKCSVSKEIHEVSEKMHVQCIRENGMCAWGRKSQTINKPKNPTSRPITSSVCLDQNHGFIRLNLPPHATVSDTHLVLLWKSLILIKSFFQWKNVVFRIACPMVRWARMIIE